MNPGQLVPNWKLIVIPLTTPSAKLRANTLVQKRYAASQAVSCVVSQRQRKKSSTQPRAMVIVGNRMWKVMFAANCIRARINASIE